MSNKLIYYLKKYKKNSIYFQGFIKTILVFLLSLIILGGLIYTTSSNIIERLINEYNDQSLRQIIKETDYDIDVSLGMLIQFAANEYFQLNPTAPLQDKVEFMRQFSIPFNVKKFVDSIYVHSAVNDEIAVVNFNDVGITNIYELGDTGWLSYYNEHPPVSNYPLLIGNRTIKRNDNQISALSIMMKYPLNGDYAGFVVINIDKKKLFDSIKTTENEKYYVTNEKDEVIFGDEASFQNIKNILNNQGKQKHGQIISSETSSVTNFNYIKVYNTIPHLKETNKLFFIELIIFLICSLIGLFELSRITFRAYNPLLEISDKFSKLIKTENEKNEIDLINKVVTQILDDKNSLENLYIESTPDIIKGIMLRIISGEKFFLEEYILKQLESFGFGNENGNFLIIVIRLSGYDVVSSEFSNNDLISIKNMTEDIFDTEAIALSYIKEDTLMTMLGGFDLQKIKDQCNRLYNKLKDEFNLTTTIGIGNEVSDITALSSSYFSALSALNIAFFTGSAVQDGKPSENYNEKYTYPTAMEWSLVVAVKKGDEEEANKIIDNIYKSIPRTSLMAGYVTDIFWQLLNGIFVSLTTINIKYEDIMGCSVFDTHQIFKNLNTASNVVNFTKEIVLSITQYIKNEKIINNDRILKAAKDYINQNYHNPELSLKHVAKTINFSPSYFSLIIKEILGESFRDYLLKVRMENAIKLLLETKMPVASISVKVGYENNRSFLRAFKTFTGFTPTDYRKQYLDMTPAP